MLNRDFKEFAALFVAKGVEYFEQDTVVQLGRPPRRIDLLTAIDGVDFDHCFSRREGHVVEGVLLDIIALEDFKANRRASGRLKDLADLESLGEPDPRQPPDLAAP